VSPGAAYGSAKRWLPERFARISQPAGRRARRDGRHFRIERTSATCAKSVARLIAARSETSPEKTTLSEFIELAAACRVYLTNDSGAMHIASALVFRPSRCLAATDDEATGPTGPLARVVREPVECSPCLKRECPSITAA